MQGDEIRALRRLQRDGAMELASRGVEPRHERAS